MSEVFYKAVRLDKTSHYDRETSWRVGRIVQVENPDPPSVGPCGRGIHCSPTLLDAVSYQNGPSLYCVVEPLGIIASDSTKSRCSAVRVKRWLGQQEQDELAGFKLYEANHPFHPFKHTPQELPDMEALVKEWDSVRASVRASVWDSVGASVRDSVGASVWASVGASVGASVWASVWASVRASVGASVWAYIGGLFPNITTWKYAKSLDPDPWRPLLILWYAGYIPSFDGKTWRVHAGPKAKVVATYQF